MTVYMVQIGPPLGAWSSSGYHNICCYFSKQNAENDIPNLIKSKIKEFGVGQVGNDAKYWRDRFIIVPFELKDIPG